MSTTSTNMDRENARRLREWGLVRMIFVDSYSEGRVVEFDVTGGAALAGGNGEGKTALLSILPLFHGEQPNRLVRKEENRQSLAAHYLSRQTSYIIFEYAQDQSQLRMSVMSANPSNDSVEVMLVRSGYQEHLFRNEDGTWVQRTGLRGALTTKGLTLNGWYELAQYRRILHRMKSGKDNAKLAEFYAVAPPGTSLGGMERIVGGMFRRATRFDEIADIVVREVVSDDEDSVSLKLDRDTVERWRSDYAAYGTVEDHRGQHDILRDKSVQREAARVENREAKLRLNAFVTHARLRIMEIESELKDIAKTRIALDEDRERMNGWRVELASLKDSIDRSRTESREFLVREREYRESGIEKTAEDLKRVPEMIQDIELLKKEIEALEGDVSNLNAKYADMASAQREIAAGRLQELHLDAKNRSRPLHEARQTGQRHLDETTVSQESELEEAGLRHDAIIEAAMTEKATAQARLDNPIASPKAKSEYEAAVLQHRSAEEEDRAARQAHVESEREVGRINERLTTLDSDLDSSRKRLADVRDRVRVAKEKVEGPDGSILRWARDNAPERLDDLTKILTDSVLLRRDLEPEDSGEGRSSVFGIRIDASKLPEASAGRRESAEQELESAQRSEKAAVEDEKTREEAISASKKALKAAQTRSKTTGALAATTPSKLKLSLAAMQAKEENLRQDQARSITAANMSLNAAEGKLKKVKTERDGDLASKRQAISDRRQAWNAERTRIDAALEGIDVQLDQDIGIAEIKLKDFIERNDRDRDVELRSRNIDVDALKPLRARLLHLERTKTSIERLRSDVARWEIWNESEPRKHREREERLLLLVRESDASESNIKNEDRRIKTRTNEADRLEEDANSRMTKLKEDADKVEQQLRMSHSLEIGAVEAWRPEEDLGSMQKRAFEAAVKIEKLSKEMDRGIRILHDAFTRHRSDILQDALTSDIEDGGHATDELDPYTQWYDGKHLEMKGQMIIQARNIIRIVADFHAGLDRFDKGVRDFNREIQISLTQASVFKSLTGLEMTISTTYEKMKWWKVVDAANDKGFEMRNLLDANQLPGPEYAKVLEELMATWKDGAGLKAELRRIVDITGHVMDKGRKKTFSRDTDLTKLSSNGLSYLILASILTAFVDRIRGKDSKTTIIWAIDELRDLDGVNVTALVKMLAIKKIEIVSAFTATDSTYMKHFANRYSMLSGRRIQNAILRDRDAERIQRRASWEKTDA